MHWKQGLGDVQGPMFWNVCALEEGPGLPLPTALPELAASWARQDSSLPISKAGWKAVGSRPRPEAAGVSAKRAAIHAPYPKRVGTHTETAVGQASRTSEMPHEIGEKVPAATRGSCHRPGDHHQNNIPH